MKKIRRWLMEWRSRAHAAERKNRKLEKQVEDLLSLKDRIEVYESKPWKIKTSMKRLEMAVRKAEVASLRLNRIADAMKEVAKIQEAMAPRLENPEEGKE